MRGCVAVAFLSLCVFSATVSALRAPEARGRNGTCTEYSLPAQALLSGNGKLWEYYHFLVDFAPIVYYHIRNDTASCKVLYVPGWRDMDKFSLAWSSHPQWSMRKQFDYLFAPLGLALDQVASQEQMAAGLAGRRLIKLNGHSAQGWSNQPAEDYAAFRSYALALPGTAPSRTDVLAVKRGRVKSYKLNKMAYDRRHLEDSFYAHLEGDMATRGWSTRVVSLEEAPMAEQISLFSGARVIVAQHGAALSNMLFAQADALVVEIGIRERECYETLARKLGLLYLYFNSTSYPGGLSSIIRDTLRSAGRSL